jgi:Uma2 family endonuclease
MSSALFTPPQAIVYPETDDQPMAENTLQFQWIVTVKEGLEAQYIDVADVFVAGDLFWYPVEGHPEIRTAPDTLVAFGRPKGHRPSYLQWEEGNIPPQVVFEIRSPSNRNRDLLEKLRFYDQHGVEEYYLYDPETGQLEGWLRNGEGLQPIESMHGWVSPRLGVRFELVGIELRLYHPDGSRFLTVQEVFARSELARQAAEQERQRAEQEWQRAERLAAKLRALGIDPEADQ